MDTPRNPRPRRTLERFASHAEAAAREREYWALLTDAERVLETWRLSDEQWRLMGQTDESRFSRSVTRLLRR